MKILPIRNEKSNPFLKSWWALYLGIAKDFERKEEFYYALRKFALTYGVSS